MAVSDWRDIDDMIVINPELSFGDDIEEADPSMGHLTFDLAKERLFKLLNYLELVSLDSVDDLLHRAFQKNRSFVVIPAHSGNFDVFFLKMSLEPMSMARLKLNRELFFSERFNEEHVRKLLSFCVPTCVKLDAGMSWVLYRGFERLEVPEEEGALSEELFMNLPKPFSSETLGDEYTKQIISSLKTLQGVSISSLVLPSFAYMLRLEKASYESLLAGFQKIQKQLHYSNLISSKHWYRLYQLLEERRRLITHSSLVLSHGSFTEDGMIFGETSLYLFNWSKVRICHASYDLASLWMSAHQHVAWRRNLVREYLKDVEDADGFLYLLQVDLLYLSLQMIQQKAKAGIKQERDVDYQTFLLALEDIKKCIL